MKSNLKFKSGQMLIIGIIFSVIILLFSTTIFSKVSYFINFGANTLNKKQALHIADAGIDKAAKQISQEDPQNPFLGESNVQVGTTGKFTTLVESFFGLKTITSTGCIPDCLNSKAKQTVGIDLEASFGNTNLLAGTVQEHTTVINNGYMYVLGGWQAGNCASPLTAQFTRINPIDSHLDQPWQTPSSNPPRTASHASVAANGFVYIIGGVTSTCSYTRNVVYAKPDPATGQITSWTTLTNVLPIGIKRSVAVYNNGYIYLIGGESNVPTNPSTTSTIYRAQVNITTGAIIDSFTSYSSFPRSIERASLVVANGYAYVVGGLSCPFSGCGLNTVYYAQLLSNGDLGSFTLNSQRLPTTLYDSSSAVVNNYLYTLGGIRDIGGSFVPIKDIFYAQIGNPAVGQFNINDIDIPNKRSQTESVVYNNYIYLVGGYGGNIDDNTTYGNTWVGETDPVSHQIIKWTDNFSPIAVSGWAPKEGSYRTK